MLPRQLTGRGTLQSPTRRDPVVLGQPQLRGAGVVFGKSLLPTPQGPFQRCFFDLSCRTAFCLASDGEPFRWAPLPAGYPCPCCLLAPWRLAAATRVWHR